MAIVRFHFDFLSPYAYLAWKRIHPLAERCGATVEPAPLLFAALLNHHGQRGPAEISAKRIYVFKDALRRALLAGLPFSLPPSHPFNPLLALRAVLAAAPEERTALVDGLFDATWGGELGDDRARPGVDEPEVVGRVLREVGLDAEATLARAATPAIKQALRDATGAAIADGVFGVPTMQVGRELFWGTDSLDLLELHLRGEDPLTDEIMARFGDVPASAQR